MGVMIYHIFWLKNFKVMNNHTVFVIQYFIVKIFFGGGDWNGGGVEQGVEWNGWEYTKVCMTFKWHSYSLMHTKLPYV